MAMPAGELIRVLMFDGEGCNGLVRKVVHGMADRELTAKLQELRWFSQLRHTSIKGVEDWPSFPIRACKIGDEHVYALCGPAHAIKNSCGQVMSELRVVYFGNFFADAAGTLSHYMPLPAYIRADPMSDRLAALLQCPTFLASTLEA